MEAEVRAGKLFTRSDFPDLGMYVRTEDSFDQFGKTNALKLETGAALWVDPTFMVPVSNADARAAIKALAETGR